MINPLFIINNKDKIKYLIIGAISQGFFQMQANIVSSKILIDAMEHPENHQGLIVRVWGFSAYFNDLPDREIKEDKSCGLWNKFLFDYAKEELGLKKREAFNRHIKDCPRCNVFLDSYLKAIKLTGALNCRDIPEELKANLKTFLLRRKNT